MKTFFNRLAYGGFGGAVGVVLYSLIVSLLLFGKLPAVRGLASQAMVMWVFFGLLFALIHTKRAPSIGSSMFTSFTFIVAISLLSGLAAVASVNLLVIVVLTLFALLVGTTAFYSFSKQNRIAAVCFAILMAVALL